MVKSLRDGKHYTAVAAEDHYIVPDLMVELGAFVETLLWGRGFPRDVDLTEEERKSGYTAKTLFERFATHLRFAERLGTTQQQLNWLAFSSQKAKGM